MAQLLGPTETRALAARLGLTPSKRFGQNFVVDAGTVRRIARIARISPGESVLEIGPGLGSLTLALLEAGARVIAVEIDPGLADRLPATIREHAPESADRLAVVQGDALDLEPDALGDRVVGLPPTAMVSNLPYNVAVPVLLTVLERWPGIGRALVLVQAEVADRIVAPPGSRTYGIPSVKVAWHASARLAGTVGRAAFWPVPRVDSALVLVERRPIPETTASREDVFRLVDAAFAQRRKGLRAALAPLAGSPAEAETALVAAGIDPLTRGERLSVGEFAHLAETMPFPRGERSGTVRS